MRAAHAIALDVVDIECLRGDALIFEHLSFSVPPGRVVQILGANGSGKTSLLRLLSGLSTPTAGDIFWHGEPIRVSARFQDQRVYQGISAGFSASLTVRENLEHALALAARGVRTSLMRALAQVGLAQCEGTLLGLLSSGQRQRVALARLLLVPSQLWLLDEPLTALDRAGKKLLEEMLRAHVDHGGVALVATHQPLEIPASLLQTLDMDRRATC